MLKLPSPWRCVEPCRGTPGGTVIHATQEIPSDQNITHHSRAHQNTHISFRVCVCVGACELVRTCGCSSFLQTSKAQIQSHHLSVVFACEDERLVLSSPVIFSCNRARTSCKMSACSAGLRCLCPFQKSLQCSDSL